MNYFVHYQKKEKQAQEEVKTIQLALVCSAFQLYLSHQNIRRSMGREGFCKYPPAA
jgi:hypothetical protein